MENAITAALSQQLALTRALDVTANNIANQTTNGFKAEKLPFLEYLQPIEPTQTGDPIVSLVYDADSYTDFSPGGLNITNAPLDFAITGSGFFGVLTDDGVRYSRDGRFTINNFGELTNRSGALVLDDGGSPILIDPEQGPVLLSPDGELQQAGAPIARLGVFDVADQRSLRREGDGLFRTSGEDAFPVDAPLEQGAIEISNVDPILSMTQMIDILRSYENAAQMIETANNLARDAVQTLTQTA